MRACIYTAIHGGYDSLKAAVPQSEPADFVCFTDGGIDQPAAPWIVCRDQRHPRLDPRLRAKWFKTHPHTLFPRGRASLRHNRHLALARLGRRYDLTIWIDGSVAIKGEHFVRDMRASLEGSSLAGRGWLKTLTCHPSSADRGVVTKACAGKFQTALSAETIFAISGRMSCVCRCVQVGRTQRKLGGHGLCGKPVWTRPVLQFRNRPASCSAR